MSTKYEALVCFHCRSFAVLRLPRAWSHDCADRTKRSRQNYPFALALLCFVSICNSAVLDVLAGKKTGGRITGEILLNGRPRDVRSIALCHCISLHWLLEQDSFNRIAGYCEQVDSHDATSTIREAIMFSAELRLPAEMPHAEKVRRVDK